MTRFGTIITSTVVAALVSVVPDASAQIRAVSARADRSLRPVAAALHGSLEGIVIDDAGKPIAGATVSALGNTSALTVTDGAGRFYLRSLPPGPYLVRAHFNGCSPSRRQLIEIRAAGKTTLSVSLHRNRVLGAGVGTEEDGQATENHTEVAWRLRHLGDKRSVLKDVETEADGIVRAEAKSGDDKQGLAHASGQAQHAALNFLNALPLTGQVNLLTSGSFDSLDRMFSPDTVWGGGIASVSLGGTAGALGDWSLQGMTSQGSVGSWFLSGSLKSRVAAEHAYDVNVSYSTLRLSSPDSASPVLTQSNNEDTLNVGSVDAVDRWHLSRAATLTYGARYSRYDYLGGSGFLSPRASLSLAATPTLQIRTSVSRHVLAPGAEEFLPPLAVGLWVPTERTFESVSRNSMRAERASTYEFELEHNLGSGYTVTARTFYQEVTNQLVALFGVDAAGVPGSRYHVGSIGDVEAHGWSLGVANGGKRLRGSVAYQMTIASWRDGGDASFISLIAPSVIRTSERLHDVTTSVETELPVTATRVFVLYKVDTSFSRRTASESRPGFDGRFDVQVAQPLPLLGFTAAQWQVVFAIRNMFRESAPDASIYDELLVVRPPKRLVGGLVVRF